MNKRYLRIATAALFAALSLHAEEDAADVVVTANRTTSLRSTIGSSVSVVDADQIRASNHSSALEVLRAVPGVSVVQAGGPGQVASVFLRGASSSQALILMDGLRINSPATGGYDLSNLKTENLERIEIVRGPQSTLYGSDAMGGVINLITSYPEEDATSVRAQAGSRGHGETAASITRHIGETAVSAGFSYETWEGDSLASEALGNTEKDGYENTTASLSMRRPFAGDGEVRATLRALQSENDADGFSFDAGPVDDLNYEQERDARQAALHLSKPLSESVNQSFSVGIYDEELEGSDPDTEFNNFLIDSRVLDLNLQTDVTLTDADVFTLGYSYQHAGTDNEGQFDESEDVHGVFAQHQHSHQDNLHSTLALRYNDHSSYGSESTYRATLAWVCPSLPASRIHASVGSGFHAPTLNDLYFPGFGNPDLDAETSTGWDIGVQHGSADGRLVVDATWFANDFEDLIGFDSTTFNAINIAEAETSGLEVSARFAAHDAMDLSFTHTYTDSEDKATGAALPRRPEHQSSAMLLYHPAGDLSGTLSVLSVNERTDSDGSDMEDYTHVDLSLTWSGFDAVEPYLRVDNLLDDDAEEVTGFTSPGLTVIAGVRSEW